MNIDIISIKKNLNEYEPFSLKAKLFARYVAKDIVFDNSVSPIQDLRAYFAQKLDFVRGSFDAYDYIPTTDLAGLTDVQYSKLEVYIRNMFQYVTNDNGFGADNAPKARVSNLIGFFDNLKAKPLRDGEKTRHVVNFPAIADQYVNGELALTHPVLEELEALALSSGRA